MTIGKGFQAAAGVTVLATAVALNTTSSLHATPPSSTQDVRVVNAAAQPVPTTAVGTTSVSGAVGASQSGAWSVGITGTPSVALAREPVTFEQPSLLCGDPSCSYVVPPGKRLVVEEVYPFVVVLKGAVLQVFLTIVKPSTTLSLSIFTPRQGTGSLGFINGDSDVYVGGGPVRAYADAGDAVRVDTFLTPNNGYQELRFPVIVGYLETVQ
jgi:hypothetical protein